MTIDVLDFMDAIIAVVSIIAGIIAAVILPFVLGVVIGIIAYISVTVASILLAILLALPGAGWAVLLAVAGIAVINAAIKGGKAAKEFLLEKLQTTNLPDWVRKRMSDKKMDESLAKANIKAKIEAGILEEESRKNITEAVALSLRGQIEKRAEDIKYVIESR